MSPEMKELLHYAAAPGEEPDIAEINERARRYGWRRRAVMVGTTACLVAIGALGAYSLAQETASPPDFIVAPPEQTEIDIPIEQRAATVAIASLHEAGLADPEGTYFDYGEVKREQHGFVAHFCSASPPSGVCEAATSDSSITVVESDDDLSVQGAEGTLERHADLLVGYREPVDDPRIGQVFTSFVRSDERGRDGSVGVSAALYWRGPIPSRLGATCEMRGMLRSGERWTHRQELPSTGPLVEGARDGVLSTGVPKEVDLETVEVVCGEYQQQPKPERPDLPEGPGTLVAQDQLPESARGEFADVRWELTVWDEQARWCWGFFTTLTNDTSHTCVPRSVRAKDALWVTMLTESDDGSQAIAYGQLRGDVRSVRVPLDSGTTLEAEIFEPPGAMEIPASYYFIFLPELTSGKIEALDEGGKVLQSRRVKPRKAPPAPG